MVQSSIQEIDYCLQEKIADKEKEGQVKASKDVILCTACGSMFRKSFCSQRTVGNEFSCKKRIVDDRRVWNRISILLQQTDERTVNDLSHSDSEAAYLTRTDGAVQEIY